MRVFSKSIESFLKKLTLWTKQILRDEFAVEVGRSRFHTDDGWSWPILLVAIDDATRLGYFDVAHYTIGVHKSLMYTAKDHVVKDLLRHELAHYFTYIEHCDSGVDFGAHGAEFRAVCERYGLAPGVRAASIDVRGANEAVEGELQSEAVIEKVRKLLSLAESDNENEAALATLRANELMLKHNLDGIAAAGGAAGEIEYCVKLVIASKRSSPRLAAISRILREFLVVPVQTSDGLEVTGTHENVENAEYIAHFLDRELHAAWQSARRERKGLKQKAFMTALASSYRKKLAAARGRLPANDQRALVLVDETLSRAADRAYGGLRSVSSSYRVCRESASLGAEAGARLQIHRGVGANGVLPLLGG